MYVEAYRHKKKKHADRGNIVNIYIDIFNTHIHFKAYIYMAAYGHVYPYIQHLVRPRGAQKLFTVYSHPESWCTLHQANTAMVQHHPTFMQRAVVPAQLPRYMVPQMNKLLYK